MQLFLYLYKNDVKLWTQGITILYFEELAS